MSIQLPAQALWAEAIDIEPGLHFTRASPLKPKLWSVLKELPERVAGEEEAFFKRRTEKFLWCLLAPYLEGFWLIFLTFGRPGRRHIASRQGSTRGHRYDASETGNQCKVRGHTTQPMKPRLISHGRSPTRPLEGLVRNT